MKYPKHYYPQSFLEPRLRTSTFQTSNTTTSKKKTKSSTRPSSFENNLAESCRQTKKMIDDYEYQVDAMKKRHGSRRCYDSSKRNQSNGDRYDVYKAAGYGRFGKRHDIEMGGGDETDSLTSLTDDLTYYHNARRATATRLRKEVQKTYETDDVLDDEDNDNETFLPGSANDPFDLTMCGSGEFEDRDYRNDNLNPHWHPFNRDNDGLSRGSSRNSRSGRFSSKEWKESIRRRRSLFNSDDEEEDEEDYGEADEDWPGARIPLGKPVRRRKPPSRKQLKRNRRLLMEKMNEFDAALDETHSRDEEEENLRMGRHHHKQKETERLKQALVDQRHKFDEEKGALYIKMERLQRDHGIQVDKLQSKLCEAQESHQVYLKKLNEVIDYHESLHEKETVTMNKIVEQVKKEKREEVSRLNRELDALKAAPPKLFHDLHTDDVDMQQCIKYLSKESESQKHRRDQFKDTMVALKSIASKASTTAKKTAGFSNRDLQDIDGLLEMLHHVYNVAENSHQKTLCMSHMLIEECTEMSKTAQDFGKMKDRLDCLERESMQVENQFRGARKAVQTDPLGTNIEELTNTIGRSFDGLTKSIMENNLYRGLGLAP